MFDPEPNPDNREKVVPPPESLKQHPGETIALGNLLLFKQLGFLNNEGVFWTRYENSLRTVIRGDELPPDEFDIFFRMEALVGSYTEYYANSVRAKYDIKPKDYSEGEIIQNLTPEEVKLLDEPKPRSFHPFSINFGVELLRDMKILRTLNKRPREHQHDYPPDANRYFQDLFWAEDPAMSRVTSEIEEGYKGLKDINPELDSEDINAIRMFAELHALITSRVFEPPKSVGHLVGLESNKIAKKQPWEEVRWKLYGMLYLRDFYGSEKGRINLIQTSGNRQLDLDQESSSCVKYCLQMIDHNYNAEFPEEVTSHFIRLYGDESYTPTLVSRRKGDGLSSWEKKLRKQVETTNDMRGGPTPGHPSGIGIILPEDVPDDYAGHLPGDPDDPELPYFGNLPPNTRANRGSRAVPPVGPDSGELPPPQDVGGGDNPFKDFINKY